MKLNQGNEMKKLLILAAALVATPAMSADLLYTHPPKKADYGYTGWYIAGHASANFVDDFGPATFDTGYGFSGAFGNQFGQFSNFDLRGEVEFGYLNASVDNIPAPFSIETDAIYGFANAYADFDFGFPLTPYIGGGIGYARTQAEFSNGVVSAQATDDNFAWNLTAGVSYELTADVSLDVGYRFIQLTDVTFGPLSDNVDIHQVNAGVRVKL